jgi:hypothetical protein
VGQHIHESVLEHLTACSLVRFGHLKQKWANQSFDTTQELFSPVWAALEDLLGEWLLSVFAGRARRPGTSGHITTEYVESTLQFDLFITRAHQPSAEIAGQYRASHQREKDCGERVFTGTGGDSEKGVCQIVMGLGMQRKQYNQSERKAQTKENKWIR